MQNDFHKIYTTEDKKTLDAQKEKKDQTEQEKTILSNDAYAMGEILLALYSKLEQLRMSSMRK